MYQNKPDKPFQWIPTAPESSFTEGPRGSATVILLNDGRWRWEANPPKHTCPRWSGFNASKEGAQKDAEDYLSAFPEKPTPVTTTEEKTTRAREALQKALDCLPHCRCGTLATHLSLDAAGMGLDTCQEHSRPGGMDGGEGPFPRPYVAHLQEALNCLGKAQGPETEWNTPADFRFTIGEHEKTTLRLTKERDEALGLKPTQPRFCKHCPFAEHLHDGKGCPAGCPGFEAL